ncbi:hypothetical protein MtrunA17_Chr2g0306971 [Medicago truncatula]|uniref:Transposase (putative) gypsy type domain-containing protein n=1 Tax=Medicago truncatula TaxID=3880 RepID=A0A396JCG7_MEDTR|nr:hypothetical protein MtrunA17_Chr2g0306971 [Medicago truncatula]
MCQGKALTLTYPSEIEMAQFAEEVLQEYSLFTNEPDITFFQSKLDISSSSNEEDVVVLPCGVDERVCDKKLAVAQDEFFLMYMKVLEELGVTIPFTAFEMCVLKFMNMAPSHIRPNSWSFIRGFEIFCKAWLKLFNDFCRLGFLLCSLMFGDFVLSSWTFLFCRYFGEWRKQYKQR